MSNNIPSNQNPPIFDLGGWKGFKKQTCQVQRAQRIPGESSAVANEPGQRQADQHGSVRFADNEQSDVQEAYSPYGDHDTFTATETPEISPFAFSRLPTELAADLDKLSRRSTGHDSDSGILFGPSNSFHVLPPVIDSPNPFRVIPHPLFSVFAVYTSYSLVLVSAVDLSLLQIIIEPVADTQAECQSYPRHPIRLQDAPRLFGNVQSGDSSLKTKCVTLPASSDRLLCCSWHRDSITLAVGTAKSLMIFKPDPKQDHSDPTNVGLRLHCVFFHLLGWPCSCLFWLRDGLLTKSTVHVSARSSPQDEFRSKKIKSHLPPSQFFFWKCDFFRPDARSRPDEPHTESLSALSVSPALRDEWHPGVPIAEFRSCSEAPLFSWKAVAGANIKPLPAVPQPLVTDSGDNDADKITVDVRRIVPEPAGRFLAVLYGVVINRQNPNEHHVTSDIFSIPSPVVRVWSLGPHSIDDEYQDESNPDNETKEPAGQVKKRRRLLRMGTGKTGGGFGRSCFLSGVSNLLHIRHKHKQSDPYVAVPVRVDEGLLQYQQETVDGDLQGPEWAIVRSLAAKTTNSEFPAVDHRESLLALLVSRGLISEDDLDAYQNAAWECGGCRPPPSRLTTNMENIEHAKVDGDVQFNWMPAVLDGPYLCTSLNHRAPVVDVVWKDVGPITDEVFVPSVVCSLTMDNCITLWMESPSDNELWFEAVILLRLDVSPLKNFFDPVDILHQPGSSTFADKQRDPGVAALASCGLRSAPFDEGSVSLCWLSCHHVPFDSHSIHNFIRLCQSEAKSQLVELELLANRKIESFSGSDRVHRPPVRSDEELKSQKLDDVIHDGILSFRPSGHSRLEEHARSATPQMNVVPTALGPAALHTVDQKSSRPLLPLMSVVHRQNVVDFLLLCEVSRGHDGPVSLRKILTSDEQHGGLWVYTIRELSSQPRGSPAVKRLLEPQHLPLPCKIRRVVSVECLSSLGLSDACWGDGTALITGQSVLVTDGIILPACIITVLTIGGQLWNFYVRPNASSAPGGKTGTQFDAVEVSYEVHFGDHFSRWTLPYHVLNTADLQFETVRSPGSVLGSLRSMMRSPTMQRHCEGAASSRLKLIYWKQVEEHPAIPKQVLALDNRGWLFAGSLTSTPPVGEVPAIPTLLHQTDSSVKPLLSRSRSGVLIPTKAGIQRAGTDQEDFFHHDYSLFENTSGSDLICLHAIAGPWIDSNLVEQQSPMDFPRSSTRLHMGDSPCAHCLPPLRNAMWIPTSTQPPILLAVTEPRGHLLALEVSIIPGQCPRIRGLGIVGSFCESLVSALHLAPQSVDYPDNNVRSAAIGSMHIVHRTQTKCLFVVRVSLVMMSDHDEDVDHRLLREEHVIAVHCYEVRASDQSRPLDSIPPGFYEKRVLRLDMIADAFIDFSPRHIGLVPFVQNECFSYTPPITEIIPHISVCSAATAGGVVGMMAVFPPLVSRTELDNHQSAIGENHGGRNPNTSFVGIYDILESGSFRLEAWAAVPTRRAMVAGSELENDEIVAVSLNQEWIAVMTTSAQLYMFSLLENPPIPNVASLSRVLVAAAGIVGLPSSVRRPLAIPVLAPVTEMPFMNQLSSLRFNARNHRRKLAVSISKLESVGDHLPTNKFKDSSASEEQQKYFKERKEFFDERLQLGSGRAATQTRSTELADNLARHAEKHGKFAARDSLCPFVPGEMPILSFRRTRGDGLCLLVLLRCGGALEVLNSADASDEEFRLTPSIILDLPPETAPYLLLRTRKEGLEGWWRYSTPLFPLLRSLALHGLCWTARSDRILLSMSQLPSCLQDGCLQVQSMKLPSRLKYLARALSSPRPIYHPASLFALVKHTDDAIMALKVLKRLLEGLTLWRHAGRPLPPTIDLPIAFLSFKTSPSQNAGSRDSLRDNLLTKLRAIVSGSSIKEDTYEDEDQDEKEVTSTILEGFNATPADADSYKMTDRTQSISSEAENTLLQGQTKVPCTAEPSAVLTEVASGGETAAALFGDSNFDVDFNLSMDSDEDSIGQVKTDDSEKKKVDVKIEEENLLGADVPDFRRDSGYTRRYTTNTMDVLQEATLEDLAALVAYIDISLPHNIKWIETHMNLVPHLSIAEATQLLGLIRVLMSLHPERATKSISNGVSPLLTASWNQGSSTVESGNIDVAGGRFLLAYHNALAVTVSYINLVKSVDANIKLPGNEIINWRALFPRGLSSVSTLEGGPHIISPLEASDSTSPLSPSMDTHYSLTTNDLCWAVQCQSDDVLLQRTLALWRKVATDSGTSDTAPKLSWHVLKHAGVGFWLRNPVVATKLASEDLPRDIFLSQPADDKDPDRVALWYIATGRVAVLRTLYKTARNEKLVEFLSHNFEEERWKAAAVKNAYALVRQRRYELAVAFFILGGSFSEAMDICCGQIDDPQLALLLALLLEHQELNLSKGKDTPLARKETAIGLRSSVLDTKILPLAVRNNDAWLRCLALWLLGRYEEAVVATLPPDLLPHIDRESSDHLKSFSKEEEKSLECSPGVSSPRLVTTPPQFRTADSRVTMQLSPDPFQRHISLIGGIRHSDTDHSLGGSGSGSKDDRITVCSGAIRYSTLNPTIALYRRFLFGTVQLRRVLQKPFVAPELVEVIRYACEKEGAEECCEYDGHTVLACPTERDNKIPISSAVIAALMVLCEEIINCLDLGEALLFCLSHRLAFQGLQHFTELRTLMNRITKTKGSPIFDMFKTLGTDDGCLDAALRVRWNSAVGFSRHACDALGYLTAVKLKETEADVEWMDEIFDATVECFGQKKNPLQLGSSAWRRVVDDHGCEHHFEGENFVSWVSRQIMGPVEIQPLAQSSISGIDLPEASPDPPAPVVESIVENPTCLSPRGIHSYDEQRHREAWLVEIFESALRGSPAWSLLSSKQGWTEQVVFRGLSTHTLGLIDLLSNAHRIGTFGSHSFHKVLAKTLTLQAGVKTAAAWSTQPTTSSDAIHLLLIEAILATSCIAVATALLLLMRLHCCSSRDKGSQISSDEMKPNKESAPKLDSLSDEVALHSVAWKDWPLHLPPVYLWRSLDRLLSGLSRLERCYIDSLGSQQIGWLESVDGKACAYYICSELLRFLSIVVNDCLMQKPERATDLFDPKSKRAVASPVKGSSPTLLPVPSSSSLAKHSQHLTFRSEVVQALFKEKAESALNATIKASDGSGGPELKQRMRGLISNIVESAWIDRILGNMITTEDSVCTLLELYVPPTPPKDFDIVPQSGSVWYGTVCQTFSSFKGLSTKLRVTFHGPIAVESYGELLTSISTEFPYLPMALTSPLAFPKDNRSSHDESVELIDIDNACVALAAASGVIDMGLQQFKSIWVAMNCSRRLQLLIGRGPICGFPSSLSIGTICPDQLPLHSGVVVCLKEAPLSISVDKAGDAPFIHHFGSLGSPFASAQPYGLGVSALNSGQIGRSGLGVISVATSQGVWETNAVHSILFHRSFPATTTITSNMSEKSEAPRSIAVLSHQPSFSSLSQGATHQPSVPIDYDDDPSRQGSNLATGKLRLYEASAEFYERIVAEEALLAFDSYLLKRSSDRKHGGEESEPQSFEAGSIRSPELSDSNVTKEESPSRRNTRVLAGLVRYRDRSHRRLKKDEHGMKNRLDAKNLATGQELTLYQFNMLLELLLRGFGGSLADLGIPKFDGTHIPGCTGRAALLDEESALMVSGLSLMSLPGVLQKEIHVSPQISTRFRTTRETCLSLPGPHRSVVSWVRLITSIQQRLSRNRIVELQISALPPHNSASLHNHGKPMVLLRAHPTLPVCAGVVADSQVIHSSLGTLVILLWKTGESHIRELGWLALAPCTTLQKGSQSPHPTTDLRPPTASESGNRSSILETRTPATGSKHGGSGQRPSQSSCASSGVTPIALTYADAGPVKSLEWDTTGERLIAGHNKGWIVVWQLRSDRHVRGDGSMRRKHDELVHVGLTDTDTASQKSVETPTLGLPLLTFKPHTSSCRFATFLPTASDSRTLIVTSGRGLLPTPILSHTNGTKKEEHPDTHTSAGPDEGVVCVWDISSSRLGSAQLMMADTGFEKGSYATQIIAWPARQSIVHCGRKGEVRLMSLRYPSKHQWVVHPLAAQQQHFMKQNLDGTQKQDDGSSMTAGLYGKEIVRMFLLEQSRRLVTCYEDSMVRVWDLSDYCCTESTENRAMAYPQSKMALLPSRQKQQTDSEKVTHYCAPLLWSTLSPIHGHDSSRLSLIASVMGTVFNVAPGGSPRTLLDAHMASPYHLVTVGADGFVVLTRV